METQWPGEGLADKGAVTEEKGNVSTTHLRRLRDENNFKGLTEQAWSETLSSLGNMLVCCDHFIRALRALPVQQRYIIDHAAKF